MEGISGQLPAGESVENSTRSKPAIELAPHEKNHTSCQTNAKVSVLDDYIGDFF
jgi:hypothetical protein